MQFTAVPLSDTLALCARRLLSVIGPWRKTSSLLPLFRSFMQKHCTSNRAKTKDGMEGGGGSFLNTVQLKFGILYNGCLKETILSRSKEGGARKYFK